MDYSIEYIKVNELIELIEKEQIELNPPYQRNFIWSKDDQKSLIETIIDGMPIPNLFVYKKDDGSKEMVDGQQRSKSIFRFYKGAFSLNKESGGLSYEDIDKNDFLTYRIPIVYLTNIRNEDELRKFYVLINRKGKHLNTAEVQRSEFMHTNFMKLSDEVLSNQKLINLDLFTNASVLRLNDRDFVQELLAYLLSGIKDKKKHIKDIFEQDIDTLVSDKLYKEFDEILDVLTVFDNIEKINKTRYKQKNDFYTLFTFLNKHKSLDIELLKYQYEILIALSGKDNEGRQLIRPTNEECLVLKNYAINCVSQSNSKIARKSRLDFFESILLNKTIDDLDEDLSDVLNYLDMIYGEKHVDIINVFDYNLLDVERLKSLH